MADHILVLIKFIKEGDFIELFNTKKYLNENIELPDFQDEISQILDEKNPSFKVKRITFFDKTFQEYVDIAGDFIFETNQKFKIFCEVNYINVYFVNF